jgi:hypothetical protein
MFVVEKFGVIKIGAFDVGRGALGNSAQFLEGSLCLQSIVRTRCTIEE